LSIPEQSAFLLDYFDLEFADEIYSSPS